MKKVYLIATLICMLIVSCKPKSGDDNNSGDNNGGNNGGINLNEINGYPYVDLGLPSGLKWGGYNIGSKSPKQYGDYFAWGEISPKDEYTVENSLTYGKQMGDISGNEQYDAATAMWGGSWRMPTKEEVKELFEHCEFEWVGEIGSIILTGPNGKYIILPAAGRRYGASLEGEGIYGNYWYSTPHDDSNDQDAYCLDFGEGFESIDDYFGREYGLQIRPVSN